MIASGFGVCAVLQKKYDFVTLYTTVHAEITVVVMCVTHLETFTDLCVHACRNLMLHLILHCTCGLTKKASVDIRELHCCLIRGGAGVSHGLCPSPGGLLSARKEGLKIRN